MSAHRCSSCGIPDTRAKWFDSSNEWLCPLCWPRACHRCGVPTRRPDGLCALCSPEVQVNVYECGDVGELALAVSDILKTPKWYQCVECKQPIDKQSTHLTLYGYPVVVWFVDQPYHYECAPRCERCGDPATDEMAYVNDQLVHHVCMTQGEEAD